MKQWYALYVFIYSYIFLQRMSYGMPDVDILEKVDCILTELY